MPNVQKSFSNIDIYYQPLQFCCMRKESYPSKRNCKPSHQAVKPPQKPHEARNEFNLPDVCRSSFINWLKELPAEERYLALRVSAPKITEEFLEISRKGELLGKVDNPECKKLTIQRLPVFANAFQSFLESLTLISHSQFLDCIGFDFGFVGCPEKIYETFSTLYALQPSIAEKQEKCNNREMDQLMEWISKAVSIIIEKLQQKMNQQWDSKQEIKRQKMEKKQFGIFWNNIQQEDKIRFLYGGCAKMTDLRALIQQKCHHQIDSFDLRHEIDGLLTSDSKTICNKLFKWRAKKGNSLMCSYYQILFDLWRQKTRVTKKPNTDKEKQRKSNKNMKQKKGPYTKQKLQRQNSGMMQKMQKLEKVEKKTSKKRRNKKKKEKSEEASSNQTNETEVHEAKEESQEAKKAKDSVEINVLDIIQEKMEDDLQECTNMISQQANKWHFARVKAYTRVTSIFNNCGVQTKIFGSCACGLAIGCSDVDIAVSEDILSFLPHLQTKKQKMKGAFEYFASIFQSYAWVTNLRVITTASIPIIKFTINTEVDVIEPSFSPQLQEILNQRVQNEGLVHVDLTIETKEAEKSQHLGLISTETMRKWIAEYPCLTQNTLLLKYQLAKQSLNETYTGGLNTYSLVVLIVAFYKYSSLPASTLQSSMLDNLLKFYGWEFNEKTHGVDILSKEIFFPKNKQNKSGFQKADLEVIDPLSPEKNMTRNCYKFSQIRQLFREIHKNCFTRAKYQFTTHIESDPAFWQKIKTERFSYRNSPNICQNFISAHIFSEH